MAQPTKTDGFFLSAIDRLRDPVRDTRWRVLIPAGIWDSVIPQQNSSDTMGIADTLGENFALHVKTCKIPGIDTKFAEHNYMGFKSSYPVNSEISADLSFSTILLEDMAAYELMYAWNQAILNTGILTNNTGETDRVSSLDGPDLGLGNHKQDPTVENFTLRNSNIKIELYNWANGQPILELTLINAWPSKINEMAFKYATDASLVHFDFQLHCDRWKLYFPNHKDNVDGTNP